MSVCFNCGKELLLPISASIGRSETCSYCSSDVKVCYNCDHYNIHSYNECKEIQAERVVDKTKRNFCDYFVLRSSTNPSSGSLTKNQESKDELIKKLDALFKTKNE